MNKKLLYRCLAVLLCLALVCVGAGCSDVKNIVSGVTATGEFPVDVNGVTISARPQRAVALSPSLADIVAALGYETQLAAVHESCTQSALADLPKVAEGDVQAILDLSPDLVLTDSNYAGSSEELASAGVTVVMIEPAMDRADFERMYAQVSSALAGGGAGYDAGIAVAQDIFLTLDTINRIVPKETITTGCYLYDLDGRCITGDMLGSTIMTYAGVTNVFKSLSGGMYEEFDSLRVSNPNIIFCAPGLADQIKRDSRFATFQAVENDRIVEMDPSIMEWQGRTVVEAAYEISASAFPELLEEGTDEPADPTADIESAVSSALESMAEEEDTTVYETLQQGDQGDAVLRMQTRLEELGYLDTEYDGHYGEYTASCVSDFQTTNDIEATGIADPDTQRAMFSRRALAKNGETLPASSDADSSASSAVSSQPEE